jgi:hypothetical protein
MAIGMAASVATAQSILQTTRSPAHASRPDLLDNIFSLMVLAVFIPVLTLLSLRHKKPGGTKKQQEIPGDQKTEIFA